MPDFDKRPRRQAIRLLSIVVGLIVLVLVAHTLIDMLVTTDTAQTVRSDDQNSGSRAPNEQVAPAGTADQDPQTQPR